MIKEDAQRYGISFPKCILSFLTGNTFFAILNFRIANRLYRRNVKLIPDMLNAHARKKYGCEIAPYATIGGGLFIPHSVGIVIGYQVKIERNCEIFQNVTIGSNRKPKGNQYMSIIGDNVSIGSGAVVVGAITIGNNVKIGANSYVNSDMPDNSFVAGIPAKIIKRL